MANEDLPRRIVRGQRVEEAKHQRARAMRSHMTAAEKRLWQQLRRNQLAPFHFRRQQVIDGFIADFYCHRAGLVIEVDGDLHDPDYDRERDLVFGQRGLRVLRFRNREVFHELERVLEMIREALTSPPSPLS